MLTTATLLLTTGALVIRPPAPQQEIHIYVYGHALVRTLYNGIERREELTLAPYTANVDGSATAPEHIDKLPAPKPVSAFNLE